MENVLCRKFKFSLLLNFFYFKILNLFRETRSNYRIMYILFILHNSSAMLKAVLQKDIMVRLTTAETFNSITIMTLFQNQSRQNSLLYCLCVELMKIIKISWFVIEINSISNPQNIGYILCVQHVSQNLEAVFAIVFCLYFVLALCWMFS